MQLIFPSKLIFLLQIDESQSYPVTNVAPIVHESPVDTTTSLYDHVITEEDDVISGKGRQIDHHTINTEDHMMSVEVCVSEVEEHTVSVAISKVSGGHMTMIRHSCDNFLE